MAGTTLYFDEERYKTAVMKQAEKTLKKIGERLQKMMIREIVKLDGFSGDFRIQTAEQIQNRITEKTDTFIQQSVGLLDIQDNEFAMIKARILEHGTGSRGEDSKNGAIWHWKGIAGLDKAVTNRDPSLRPHLHYESFPLPDEFNMSPGHWFENACKLIDEIFDDAMEEMANRVNPLDYFKMI